MVSDNGKHFSDKHGKGARPEPAVRDAVKAKAKDGKVACAVAFDLARSLGVSPEVIGRNVDLLDFRLTHCQLGLFGYQPEKKIVSASETVDETLRAAITKAQTDGHVACRVVWEIAARLGVGKMTVSAACEAMAVKVKPCQLGAF
jgi:hypothetical protein